MMFEKEIAKLAQIEISSWQVYAGVSAALLMGSAYALRHRIVKGLKDHRHESLHRNFFDAFVPLKKKADKVIYPNYKWEDSVLGGKKLKKTCLVVSDLYVPHIDAIRSKLDQWSTEFGVFFTRVERGSMPGTFILWRSAFEFYPIVAPRDVHSMQSSNGYVALGIRENLSVFRLPLFTGTDSHTRIAAQSSWGKTYLLAWIISEAMRTCPEARILLITSKGRGIIKKYVPRPIEILNPHLSLQKVHDKIAEFHAEAKERMVVLEDRELESDLSKLCLIVVDEASDVLSAKTTKPTDDEEALRQSITSMLSAFSSKQRSLGYHVVVSSQASSLSDYPIGLRNNTHNLIVGQIDAAFYGVLFEGAHKEMFEEKITPGTWFIRTQFDLVTKVKVVHPGAHDVTSQQQTKK